MKLFSSIGILAIVSVLYACNDANNNNSVSQTDSASSAKDSSNTTSIHEESVAVPADTTTMQCFVAYDDSKQDRRPIVLVVPEWWGLNDYTKMRARELAKLGYLALVVDMYG